MSEAPNKPKNVSFLFDNPPLLGKKYVLMSMVSPDHPRQKGAVHALKIHDVCDDRSEADALAQYYRRLDPVFDIYVGYIGKFFPLVFNVDDIDAEYADTQLNLLIKTHREKAKHQDQAFIEHVQKHTNKLATSTSKEAQEQISELKSETAIQMYYRIKQLELLVQRRKEELESMLEIFEEKYSEEDINEAKEKSVNFPLAEISSYRFNSYEEKNAKEPELPQIENQNTDELAQIETTEVVENAWGDPVTSELEGDKEEVKQRTLEEIKNDVLNRIANRSD